MAAPNTLTFKQALFQAPNTSLKSLASGFFDTSGHSDTPSTAHHFIININANEVPGTRPAAQISINAVDGTVQTRVRSSENTWSAWASVAAELDAGAIADALGYTPEDEANRDTSTDLDGGSASDAKYPSQLAVKTYVDTVADTKINKDGDTLTGGFIATSFDAGTKTTGTYTPAALDGNFQHAINGGAHDLEPPADVCTMIIEYTNNASAGAIDVTAFTSTGGDTATTTNGHKFLYYITKSENYSHLNIKALQ